MQLRDWAPITEVMLNPEKVGLRAPYVPKGWGAGGDLQRGPHLLQLPLGVLDV